MALCRYTDWEVSQAHADAIARAWPAGVTVRHPILLKHIPGVTGKRITETIKSGVWVKPLGSLPGRTFSSVRDVWHRSLIVFVSGSTTSQSVKPTDYEKIRDLVRDLFQDRRSTRLNGELYSRTSMSDYDMDDTVRRKYDIDLIEVETLFREDR